MLALPGVFLTGGVLLLAGLLKALHPRPFIDHISRFGFIPNRLCGLAAFLFIEVENALAMALLLRFYLPEILPVSFFLLLSLSLLTIWSAASGRTVNCGCYGRWLWLKPSQSVLLNMVYLSFLGVAWWQQTPAKPVTALSLAVLVATVGGTGFLIKKSLKRPLLVFQPLKVGKFWQRKWGLADKVTEEKQLLLFFMKDKCSRCRKWTFILSEVEKESFHGRCIVVYPAKKDSTGHVHTSLLPDVEQFKMSPFYYSYLVDYTPSAVLLENGEIKKQWQNDFPFELFS